MEKVYANHYYMDVYEDLRRIDGSPSLYSKMINGSHRKIRLGDFVYINTEEHLKKRVLEVMKNILGDIETFNCKETQFGWEFTRYMKTDDELSVYEVVEKGFHTDIEQFTVDISFVKEESPLVRMRKQMRLEH